MHFNDVLAANDLNLEEMKVSCQNFIFFPCGKSYHFYIIINQPDVELILENHITSNMHG